MTKAEAGELPACPTIEALSRRYAISPKFAHGVLETFIGTDYDRKIGDADELFGRYGHLRFHLEYALSVNWRGRDLIRLLSGWGVLAEQAGRNPKTYLDIGCAYGGCLIALENQGYDATGIEMNERYGNLGKLNLEASGSRAKMGTGDFLSDEAIAGEAKFDLITCIDVIEHVADPAGCLRKICRLLKPKGVAYIAYPNKLSIPNVRSDTHAQCFGLTLLDYYRARAAFTMYKDGYPDYEVSDFYEPEWYVNTARAAGAEAEVVYEDRAIPYDAPTAMAELYEAFSEWTKSGSRKLDPLMRHEITREVARYSARMFQSYSEHVARNSLEEFARKWIDPLTRILVRKPAA